MAAHRCFTVSQLITCSGWLCGCLYVPLKRCVSIYSSRQSTFTGVDLFTDHYMPLLNMKTIFLVIHFTKPVVFPTFALYFVVFRLKDFFEISFVKFILKC